jgi:hypothetical protein
MYSNAQLVKKLIAFELVHFGEHFLERYPVCDAHFQQ